MKKAVLLAAAACAALVVGCARTAGVADRGEPEGTRDRARAWDGPFELAGTYYEGDGFVVNWLICGVFPNPGISRTTEQDWDPAENCHGWDVDYLKSAGGEQGIKPYEGMQVEAEGKTYAWRSYASIMSDIDFTRIYYDDFLAKRFHWKFALGYAACYIKSDQARDIRIKVGSDDGFKLWLNHKRLVERHVHRGWEMDSDTIAARLEPGHNLLLLKVDTDIEGWKFSARLTDATDRALDDVTIWLK